jgi:hypothetical protein
MRMDGWMGGWMNGFVVVLEPMIYISYASVLSNIIKKAKSDTQDSILGMLRDDT